VREGLINFIRDHYPGSLPLTRAIIQQEVINLKTS
jgi:hypothetical protein